MDDFNDVQQSYGRCLRTHDDFIGNFYEKLLARDDRIRSMFTGTDWDKQQKALRRGISMMISYSASPGLVKKQLSEIARVHSRKGHAPVDPSLYPHWIESLMDAVRECDPKHSGDLEKRWREAIQPGIDFIIEHY